MKQIKHIFLSLLTFGILVSINVSNAQNEEFYFGADLSYVNQILDHGGVYKDSSVVESPYVTMPQYGVNLARFRLWNNPSWVRTQVYNDPNKTLYSAQEDVEKSIRLSKEQGMEVLLDFHYGDTWQDPGHQGIPAAWLDIRDIEVLGDSVYNYTHKILTSLNEQGLMPEFVQVGNEINCGMFNSNVPEGFPNCGVCSDGNRNWSNLAHVLNRGIEAVRAVAQNSEIQPKIILHVGTPASVDWWFSNVTNAGVTDFEVVGFSYYPIWHGKTGGNSVHLDDLADHVRSTKEKFNREVMIMEIAYPWTTDGNDGYGNIFSQWPNDGYPISIEGQTNIMKDITQSLIDGGGSGLMYWEPAWITSNMKDKWGMGSSWENNCFYDYEGNLMPEIVEFMLITYEANTPYYAVGDALPGGWDFDAATVVEPIQSGIRKASIELSQGTFRFFTIRGDWDSDLNYAYFADQGYTIDGNLRNKGDADQNFEFVGTEGTYTLTVNGNDKTITLAEIESLPSLWVVGSAVPGGWAFNDQTVELTQDVANVWSAEIELSNGIFRFFQTFGTWDTNNNYTYYQGEGYNIDSNLEDQGESDRNFRFIGTPGNYRLTINGNDKTITISNNISTTVEWDRTGEVIRVSPNPTNGELSITALGIDMSATILTLHDIVGKVVYRQRLQANSTDFQTTIDLSGLPIGTYILQLQNDKQAYSKKIVKQ